MNRSILYNEKKRWRFPRALIKQLISDIDTFYSEYNKKNKDKPKIKYFNNEPAFIPLLEFISVKSKFEKKEIPSLGWLQDFYNQDNYDKALTKFYVEALLKTFNLYYYAENDTYLKKDTKLNTVNDDFKERQEIVKYIVSKSRRDDSYFKEFVGQYKYFVGSKRENTRYDYIYENELEIFKNGEIEVRNPFNHHIYLGIASIKTDSTLQIISYDFDNYLLDGIGNLLNFKINKYSKKVILIPGLSFSFDADGRIIFSQALLCSDITLNKKTRMIREYFDTLAKDLRLYSPEINDVLKLVTKYTNNQ